MTACDACMRRSNVISLVAPRIEALLQRPRDRVPDVLSLPDDDLLEALSPADELADAREEAARFDPRVARVDAAARELDAICAHEGDYPEAFRPLADAPPAPWLRGSRPLLAGPGSEPSVALVGSRRASSYGIEVAEELGRSLAASGVTVVSGL